RDLGYLELGRVQRHLAKTVPDRLDRQRGPAPELARFEVHLEVHLVVIHVEFEVAPGLRHSLPGFPARGRKRIEGRGFRGGAPSGSFVARFMAGRHPGTMLRGSGVGALIPLCTCGMVPLAVALRRRGGDLKHTFSFLTAGAAVSIPVLLLTWKLLGLSWV